MKQLALLAILALFTYQDLLSTEAFLKSRIIAEVGKEKITAYDLHNAYRKSINRIDDHIFRTHRDSILDFVNLYAGFRLKVADALSRGLDKDSSVIADIRQNRKILAESFFYDKMLVNPNLERFLEMRKKEYQVGIILVRHIPEGDNETMTPEDKVRLIQVKLQAGESFEDLARQYSDDKRTGNLGGLIQNYITSGKVQRPIENAIYKTKAGNVYPEPIKTDFGYFFVKVFNEAPRMMTKPRHILIASGEIRSDEEAKRIADSLYNLILKGADFNKLVRENSDDYTSAEKGGDLGGYYSRSTGLEATELPLVAEFEEAIYQLEKGEYSKPVKTVFGYHIIYQEDIKAPDLDNEIEGLRRLYKTLYFTPDKNQLMDSLKNHYGYKLNEQNLDKLVEQFDTNRTNMQADWDKGITTDIEKSTLFELLKTNTTVGDFINILRNDGTMRGASLNKEGLLKAINHIVEQRVFEEATKNLETIYPEFQKLMNEFRDGIILFKVEAMEVWDKLNSEDIVLSQTYYDSAKHKYMTDLSFDISEIYVIREADAKAIYERIKNGEDFAQIAATETQRAGYRERNGAWGVVSITDNPLARKLQELNAKAGDLVEPFEYERGFSIIKVHEVLPPRQMTFEEAKTRFAPKIQDIRQKKLNNEWLANLKKKFNVKIHEKVIDEVISHYKK